ncbi:MAG TPA: hypothetical protein DCZ91_25470 [Lachnospiraceae bacterium]|nr:hypothetical protein [Lachnospiraceae bacterium]
MIRELGKFSVGSPFMMKALDNKGAVPGFWLYLAAVFMALPGCASTYAADTIMKKVRRMEGWK